MNTGEPDATEIGHVRFGGGPSEKDQVNRYLVGGLPYRTAGSASGPGKRTGRNPGTAPRAYSALGVRVPPSAPRSQAPIRSVERHLAPLGAMLGAIAASPGRNSSLEL